MAAVRSRTRAADTFLAVSLTADIYNLHIPFLPFVQMSLRGVG